MHWLFLIDWNWLILPDSEWSIPPDSNKDKFEGIYKGVKDYLSRNSEYSNENIDYIKVNGEINGYGVQCTINLYSSSLLVVCKKQDIEKHGEDFQMFLESVIQKIVD